MGKHFNLTELRRCGHKEKYAYKLMAELDRNKNHDLSKQKLELNFQKLSWIQ